jgi:ketosteroid isomerase-like protein
MKKNIILFVFLILTSFLSAQSNEEKAVADRVESLRQAMVSADGNSLDNLTAEKLSYGHSNGLIEDKKEYIRKITSGENDYLKLEHSKQSISISGKSAIVRLQFQAETIADGKPGSSKLHVLMVWQKQGREWKLLARQAIKILS